MQYRNRRRRRVYEAEGLDLNTIASKLYKRTSDQFMNNCKGIKQEYGGWDVFYSVKGNTIVISSYVEAKYGMEWVFPTFRWSVEITVDGVRVGNVVSEADTADGIQPVNINSRITDDIAEYGVTYVTMIAGMAKAMKSLERCLKMLTLSEIEKGY